jgi:hypothetical protein
MHAIITPCNELKVYFVVNTGGERRRKKKKKKKARITSRQDNVGLIVAIVHADSIVFSPCVVRAL